MLETKGTIASDLLDTGIQAAHILGDVTSKRLLEANLKYIKSINGNGKAINDHWVKNILASVGGDKIERKENIKKYYYIFTKMQKYPWHS